MVHIALTTLKIIGIILLTVIIIVLLLVLAILFISIKYKISGKYKEKLLLTFKANWLLHFISFKFCLYHEKENSFLDCEMEYYLKILGFKILDSNKKKDDKNTSEQKDENIKNEAKNESENDVKAENKEEVLEESFEKAEEKEPEHKKTSKKDASKKKRISIREFIDGKKKFFIDIRDKINSLNEKIHDKDNIKLLNFLKKNIIKLLKHILPNKYNIYIKYGASTPDVTGKVTAFVAIFAGLRGGMVTKKGKIKFVPVFEEPFIDFDVLMSGRIRIFNLLIIILNVYFNKEFRKIILKKNKK